MKKIRVASLCFVVAFVLAPLPAQAQNIPARVATLEAAVAALGARVGKLESGQFDMDDLVGTYRMHIFAIDLTGNPAKVQTETAGATLTLRDDGTALLSGSGIHCRLLQGTPWFVECDAPESGEGVEGTWSLQDGSLVLQVGGQDAISPNFIGAGGRVIISGRTLDLTEIPDRTPEVYSEIIIAIRLPNP